MKKLALIISLLIIAQTIIGQIPLNYLNIVDSLEGRISYDNSLNKQTFSKQINNLTKAEGSIVLDSILFSIYPDQFSDNLSIGVLFYDNQNRLSKIDCYDVDTNTSYRSLANKIEYTYTLSGKLSTRYCSNYYSDVTGEHWIINRGEEYFYNQNDSLIQEKKYTYNDGYKISKDYKYIYDMQGNMVEFHRENWTYNSNNSTSITYYLNRYYYNQDNLLTSDTSFQVSNDSCYGLIARTYFYDLQNNLKTNIISFRNENWQEYGKSVYANAQEDLVDTLCIYLKDSLDNWYLTNKRYSNYSSTGSLLNDITVDIANGGIEQPKIKYECFYTSNDVFYKSITYHYDASNQSWNINNVLGDSLDSFENVLFSYTCSLSSGNWDTIISERYVYNSDVNTINSTFPIFQNPYMSIDESINVNSNNLLIEQTSYSTGLGGINAYMKFYYSAIPTGLSDKIGLSSIIVYPNPVQGQINFEFDMQITNGEIFIYNTLGQKVFHQQLNGSTKYNLNISNLKTGMYIYSIISNGTIIKTNKFIKQ